jgi:hypothetical protein
MLVASSNATIVNESNQIKSNQGVRPIPIPITIRTYVVGQTKGADVSVATGLGF